MKTKWDLRSVVVVVAGVALMIFSITARLGKCIWEVDIVRDVDALGCVWVLA